MNKQIKVLEKMVKNRDWRVGIPKVAILYNEEKEACQAGIDALKAMQSSSDILPKREEHVCILSKKDLAITGKFIEGRTLKDWISYGKNQIIDIAAPLLAKVIQERDEIQRLRYIEQGAWEETKKYQDETVRVKKKKKRILSLKQKRSGERNIIM